ncbi:MAG: SDR family NAD(P)-dependent oxidoreductase [Mangrovibacterium sp.]|nr:SDR family NAD(P)-dependent oxidoreductase [Mangrovibacterium sp.]
MGKIVITGASSGIGWAIAQELAKFNKPMLLHRNKNKDLPLSELPANAEVITADFSSPDDLKQFIDKLDDTDILVNAAAYTVTELIPQTSDESIEQMIAVNVTALSKICKAVIPQMCSKRRGVIVNISSATASKVYRGQGIYAGTKAFAETFSKAIAAEYGRKGIRCNCVAPGAINTGTLSLLLNIGEDQVKQANAANRLGTPQDVAAAVFFLCREDNSFINGAVLHVDGGHWMGI